MTTSFRVGKGIGIVFDSTLALFEPLNAALAEVLWDLVVNGAGIDELLEELSTTGLRSLGSFAMAQFEEAQTRIVVRGSATAVVDGAAGRREVVARGVRTWVEEVVEGIDAVALSLAGASDEALPFRAERGLLPADLLRQGAASTPELQGLDLDWVDDFATADSLDASVPTPEKVAAVTLPEVVESTGTVPEPSLVQPEPVAEVATAVPADRDAGAPVAASDAADQSSARGGDLDPARTITAASFDRLSDASSDAPAAPTTEQLVATPLVATPLVDEGDEYDEIYGRTVARSVHSAAVHPVEEDADDAPAAAASSGLIQGIPSADATPLGDHDGHTMTKAQIAAMRAAQAGVQPPTSGPTMGGPTVQALLCPSQHPNPPQLTSCRVCHAALHSPPVHISRPALGTLRFSNGVAVSLDRPVLIGRNPKVEGGLAGEIPQLARLDVGPGLSRTHASVRLEGWQVLLEDLNSANGTIVRLPGREPRRLHPGEPVLLEVGSEVDLGGEINCVLEAS
ncbi:MAG: FHA domain-containing protein [Ilumatobacteraceae bacterium]